jgi:hypothetical protein
MLLIVAVSCFSIGKKYEIAQVVDVVCCLAVFFSIYTCVKWLFNVHEFSWKQLFTKWGFDLNFITSSALI